MKLMSSILKNKALIVIVAFVLIYFNFKLIVNSNNQSLTENITIKSEPSRVVVADKHNVTSYTTLVCVYYKINKSKHSAEHYSGWITRMLKSVRAPMVIYTDSSSFRFIQNLVITNGLEASYYVTNSVWDVMGELEKNRNRTYMHGYRFEQSKKDPEAKIHSPDLYAIWTLKTYLLNKTATFNPYESKFFLYVDMGSWRDKELHNWPDETFTKQLADKLGDRILYGQINPVDENKPLDIRQNAIQAGFFGGNVNAIAQLTHEYYKLHDQFWDEEKFVGKEQDLMTYLAFKSAKKLIVRLRTFDLECSVAYDRWFFYQYYFAQPSEYVCREDRFSILLEN